MSTIGWNSLLTIAICLVAGSAYADDLPKSTEDETVIDRRPGAEREPPPNRKFHISSTAFMLVNLLPIKDPPQVAQLNFGYRITPKDVLIFEAITWQYHAPLGVPLGKDYGKPSTFYGGRVRDYGIGIAYQRFLWKGAYVGVHATPFLQRFLDEDGEHIQSGFQLFTTARVGYHFTMANNRVFIEPSVACTAWPINTNVPESFAALDDQWPGYFLLEPGLNVGYKF